MRKTILEAKKFYRSLLKKKQVEKIVRRDEENKTVYIRNFGSILIYLPKKKKSKEWDILEISEKITKC